MVSNNITIIGPRSIGKSTFSKKLANKLNYTYFDTDEYFAQKINEAGFKDLFDFADKKGWSEYPKFQFKHFPYIYSLVKQENIIFDVGGGMIAGETNESKRMGRIMQNHSTIILLLPFEDEDDSIKLLFQRELTRKHWGDTDKGYLYHKTKKDYQKRVPYLMKIAHHIIYVKNKDDKTIFKEILSKLK